MLRERVLESAGRASSDVELAVSLSERFPATLEALAAGEITSGHARGIDRVAGKPGYRSEEFILNDAKAVPADLLSRYALRRERVEVRDFTKYQQQRQDRKASITQEPDGSWKMFAHLDYMAGRRVSLAWAKMAEAFRRVEKPDSKITYLQRNADALVQLITRDGPQRAAPASLLIIAEYDKASGEFGQPRLDDGQPAPPRNWPALSAMPMSTPPLPTPTASRFGWAGRSVLRLWPSASRSRPETADASDANPPQSGARPTTSNTGLTTVPPMSTTWRSSVPTAITSSTTATGKSPRTTDAATRSKPHPTRSPTTEPPPISWPNTAQCSATNPCNSARRRSREDDPQIDATHEFIEWATVEWGGPTGDVKARALEIWSNR